MPAAPSEAGYNARERLAQLEHVVSVLFERLRVAGDRIDTLERERRSQHVPPPAAPPRVISVTEAVRRSGISARTLRRLVESGAIEGRAVRMTGGKRLRWTVNASSLERHLAGLPATSRGRRPARPVKVES